jgi:hypothetical protein
VSAPVVTKVVTQLLLPPGPVALVKPLKGLGGSFAGSGWPESMVCWYAAVPPVQVVTLFVQEEADVGGGSHRDA